MVVGPTTTSAYERGVCDGEGVGHTEEPSGSTRDSMVACSNTLLCPNWLIPMVNVKDKVTKFLELTALQRFHKKIADHRLHWTIFETDILALDMISNKVIPDFDVSGFLAT